MRAIITTLASFALLTSVAQADGFKRITSKEDYIEQVAGKNYCNETGCWKVRKNGKMSGKFGEAKLKGKWKWSKGFACRSASLGKKDLGSDCQIVETNGKQIRVTRDQGKGKSVVYVTK
ncbi:hypothetical protein [uncultured Litoreibacter sp.]|uniref:hypothetical protein n=1 Tax=uncultured Litoreibacter sp. TaxID=1392394 RepID=UPI00260FF436|nr:hypothetical protein [uncultured Litoreibacter sp.]